MDVRHGDPALVATAIKNKGYYGSDGSWNSIIQLPNDDHLYRERVETLVIRNNKEVFVKKQPNGNYHLPGGSVEKGKSFEQQAEAECNEEAHFAIKNIKDMNIQYTKIEEYKEWVKKQPVTWDGKITHVLCAEYDGKYTGHIKKYDEDPFIRSGKWYSIKDCQKFFCKEHREALQKYLQNETGEEVMEGYINTYFKNRRFLKTLGSSPDVERAGLVRIIHDSKKFYDANKNTAKTKRLIKKKEECKQTFFPITTLEFKDGCQLTIAVCFYDDNADTSAYAIHTEEFGNLVILQAKFFKEKNLEAQIFTLLHEIGHIRLNHVQEWNQHKNFPFFGKVDTNDYRVKVASKGKVMYPEEYADLYAILNGANLYSILDIRTPADQDKEYDYTLTNREIANRYDRVYKDVEKLRGFYENGFEKEEKITMVDFDTYGQSVAIESFGHDIVFMEQKYKDCPDNQFGIPQTRSYPLNTKQRVYSACKLFGHAPDQYKVQLAKHIFSAMKRYGIPKEHIGPKSQIYQYIKYW